MKAKINQISTVIQAKGHRFNLDQYEKYIIHSNKNVRIIETFTNWLRTFIGDHNRSNIKVLDAGCGPGQLTENLITMFQNVLSENSLTNYQIEWTALDLSESVIRSCKDRLSKVKATNLKISYEKNDLENYLIEAEESSRFDIVICSHVLYYVDDWSKCITNMLNILDPHGQLWLAHASINAEIHDMFPNICNYIKTPADYVVKFAEDLEKLLISRTIEYEVVMPISEVFFSPDEINEFVNKKTIISTLEVIAFLWGYSGKAINNDKIIQILITAFKAKKAEQVMPSIQYRDGLFRICKI